MFGKKLTRDMTQGSPLKLLISFAVPLFFGNIFQQLYNVVDTIVVGRGVGPEALAAVSASASVNFLILGFVTGFTHGFSIAISQSFGSKDEGLTRRMVYMSLYLTLILAATVSVLSLIFAREIMIFMKTPADILDDATLYMSIVFGGGIFSVLYNIFASILRAFGNSKTPFIMILISSFFNVGADILFVYVFHWGVAGVAIATVMANILCLPICIYALAKIPLLKPQKGDLKWDWKLAGKLLKLGLPVGLMNCVTAVGTSIQQYSVNTMGSGIVAAYSVGHKLVELSYNATSVVGMSIGTFVGQNIGAGNVKRTKQGFNTAFWLTVAISVTVGLVLILFGKPLSAIFIGDAEVKVINDAYPYLVVCGAMMWSLGLLYVYRFALQALGDTVIPMVSGGLELLARFVMVAWLPVSVGFHRISIAEVAAWFAAMVLLASGYYVRLHKIKKSLQQA